MDKRSVVPLVLIPVDATAVNGFKPAVHWHFVKANIILQNYIVVIISDIFLKENENKNEIHLQKEKHTLSPAFLL